MNESIQCHVKNQNWNYRIKGVRDHLNLKRISKGRRETANLQWCLNG